MIIDSHLILFEGPVAAGTGNPVGLTSLYLPGKVEPILIALRCTEKVEGATSMTFTLQQAEGENDTYTDVPGTALTLTAAEFAVGKRVGWRFLPRSVESPWLRLKVAVTGTATAGKIFCAISGYEEDGYEEGQYVKA